MPNAGWATSKGRHGQPVRAAIESVNDARFVCDWLALRGREVEVVDAQKVAGLDFLAEIAQATSGRP